MQNDTNNTAEKFKLDFNIITETDQQFSVSRLNIEIRHEIYVAYMKMYRGLVMLNWTRNKNSLGQAMYNSAEQIKSFVDSKKSDTMVSTYLQQINAQHRVVTAKQMLTHPKHDMILPAPDTQRSEYQKIAINMTNQAISKINTILKNSNHTLQKRKEMSENISENGSMMHSVLASNTNQSTKTATPPKRIMMSDKQHDTQRTIRAQNTQSNTDKKQRPQIVEPKNGSMMYSENSAGNRVSKQATNPSKHYIPTKPNHTERIPKENTKYTNFKTAIAKISDVQKQDPELTHEQKKIMLIKRMRDIGNAA